MSLRSDRTDILAAIEQGRITAVEGIQRLAALDAVSGPEAMDRTQVDATETSGVVPPSPGAAAGPPMVETELVEPPVAEPWDARTAPRSAGPIGSAGARRVLRLRVGDPSTGGDRLRLSLPLGFAEAGMRMLARFDPAGDWTALSEALREGEPATLFELESEDGERVVVTVE